MFDFDPEEVPCPACGKKQYFEPDVDSGGTPKDVKQKCKNCGKDLIIKYEIQVNVEDIYAEVDEPRAFYPIAWHEAKGMMVDPAHVACKGIPDKDGFRDFKIPVSVELKILDLRNIPLKTIKVGQSTIHLDLVQNILNDAGVDLQVGAMISVNFRTTGIKDTTVELIGVNGKEFPVTYAIAPRIDEEPGV
jgi:hypothetical protein